MTKPALTNNKLYRRLQEGDRESFDVIFDRFYPALCAYGKQFVALEDAENIAQDTMLWLWENRSNHVIEKSLDTYLFRAVRNRALTLISHGKVRRRVTDSIHRSMSERVDDPDMYIADELASRLEQALRQLPPTYREAFEMNRFQGLSYKEIAERLNVSPKTFDYRIGQSLKALRKALRDFLPMFSFILD